MGGIYFALGVITGLVVACLLTWMGFFLYGHKAKRHIRRGLMDWERRHKEKLRL